MESPFSLAVRIWFAAVLTNTLLVGLFALSFAVSAAILAVMVYSFLIGGFLTVPIFLAVWMAIKTCKAMRLPGSWTFMIVMFTGLFMIIILCLLLMYWMESFEKEIQTLFALAVMSAIAGVSIYVRPLTNLNAIETTASETTLNVHSHEN